MRITTRLAGLDDGSARALADELLSIGVLFQIADDVLDYSADEAALGKHLGDDLAEGKSRLPLIHAILHSDAATRERLRTIVQEGDVGAMPEVLAAIAATGGIDYSRKRAEDYAAAAEHALDGLGDNDAVAALRGLAHYAVRRDR